MNTVSLPISLLGWPVAKIISTKNVFILSVVLSMLFSVLYVLQISLMTKEIYTIREYQNRIKIVSQENKMLEVNFSQENSLAHFDDLVKILNLEKADHIQYIQVVANQVGVK